LPHMKLCYAFMIYMRTIPRHTAPDVHTVLRVTDKLGVGWKNL
jgi:hypothetical protein